MSKKRMENVDLCTGCVRNGGECTTECTRCKFDKQPAVEDTDMAEAHHKRKETGYNRRQNAIKAKTRADMALQAAKSTALPEDCFTEDHGRVARKVKNAEKQVHRVAVIDLEFPKVPECFDKSIKASKMGEMLRMFESWKERTNDRKVYTEDQAEPIINACDNIIEILKWVNEVHEGELKAACWNNNGQINIKLSFRSKAALKRFTDAWEKIAA
jgi:hypothetical protein